MDTSTAATPPVSTTEVTPSASGDPAQEITREFVRRPAKGWLDLTDSQRLRLNAWLPSSERR